ncbi:MAG TPA: LysE family transporter [Candidatus Didemnitutus sp.]|nr:LysE family transporter [Candidatus Didemnitutus sp.]
MFFKGFILGFSIAAPVGPIGLLCIQRTLDRGRLHGFLSGLGAATADMLYGLVAALGLTSIASILLGVRFWLQLGGALFLVFLGIRTMLARPVGPAVDRRDAGNLLGAYLSIFVLTLANPATIISFLAIFSGFGLGPREATNASTVSLVLGVFLGSAAWWLTLSSITGFVRLRLNETGRRSINILAGLCIIGVGVWAAAGLRTG